MKRNALITLFMAIAVQLPSQVDPVQEGFHTSPDTVYGVLVGILIFFGVSLSGAFIWMFRQLWKWLRSYVDQRSEGDTKRTSILESLLSETKTTNEKIDKLVVLQTEQGEKIQHIDFKVEQIESELSEVKDKVGQLENELTNIKK